MYSLSIFLIAFILFLFEIIVNIVFWRELDSNILIITCVMVLPWIFYSIQNDTKKYHTYFSWSLINRVFRRKQFYFFLDLIEKYSIFFTLISTLYIYLFYLLWDQNGIQYSIMITILFLFTTVFSTILRQIFIHS